MKQIDSLVNSVNKVCDLTNLHSDIRLKHRKIWTSYQKYGVKGLLYAIVNKHHAVFN
ncbi:unnamed protein product [Tenebrio molitor]|nr:unnamed protein product [Tenebrio molitor]